MVDAYPPRIGARLQEARRLRALTQQQIADRLGVSRPTVAAIEAGHRRLSPQMLVDLADAYETDVAALVREQPPSPSLAAQFRVPLSAAPVERDRLEQAVARLEELVRDYLRLEAMLDAPLRVPPPPPYVFEPKRAEEDADLVADAERRRLGLGDGPVHALRDLLEREFGLRIFGIAMPDAIGGLLGTSDVAGGCVAVNAAHAFVRQRWTLAHELAHYLVAPGRPEVTRVAGYHRLPEIERFAERFAASFLMPRPGLERRLREILRDGRQAIVADLLVLANDFGVSAQAMILRLEDLRFVPAGQWERLAASRLQVREAHRLLDLAEPSPDARRLPRRFTLLALEAYEREMVTERELGALLRVDRLDLRRQIERFSSIDGGTADEGGAVDLGEPLRFDVRW